MSRKYSLIIDVAEKETLLTELYTEQIKYYTKYDKFYLFLKKNITIEDKKEVNLKLGATSITSVSTINNIVKGGEYKIIPTVLKPTQPRLNDPWIPLVDKIKIKGGIDNGIIKTKNEETPVKLTYSLKSVNKEYTFLKGFNILELDMFGYDNIVFNSKTYPIL